MKWKHRGGGCQGLWEKVLYLYAWEPATCVKDFVSAAWQLAPRSLTTALPSLVKRTFSGLRSRWNIWAWCKLSTACITYTYSSVQTMCKVLLRNEENTEESTTWEHTSKGWKCRICSLSLIKVDSSDYNLQITSTKSLIEKAEVFSHSLPEELRTIFVTRLVSNIMEKVNRLSITVTQLQFPYCRQITFGRRKLVATLTFK